MRTVLVLISVAVALLLSLNVKAQPCSPKDFTFRDVEKYQLSDIIKHSGYSAAIQQSTDDKHQAFAGSAVVYDVPISLSYDDSSKLSQFMLQNSGFDYSRDTRISFVRTSLSSVGAEMYKDCLAAQWIRITIPEVAYSVDSFILTINWIPQGKVEPKVPFRIRVIGGQIEDADRLTGEFEAGVAQDFKIAKSNNLLKLREALQIYVNINGMAHPPLIIPPSVPLKSVKFSKVYGTITPPRGRFCADVVNLVSEWGSSSGADSKNCVACVVKPQNGILLPDTAQTEGQLIGSASIEMMPRRSDLEVCTRFSVIGRGQNGGRQEVRDGRLYVFEATTD